MANNNGARARILQALYKDGMMTTAEISLATNLTPQQVRDNANCAIKEGRRWVNDLDAPLVIPPTEPEPVVAAPESETAPEPSEPEPLCDTIEAQLTSESACYAILHPRRGLIVVGEIRDDAIRLATEVAETNGKDVALFRLTHCGDAVLKAQFKEAA
jgi:hypothetical protein